MWLTGFDSPRRCTPCTSTRPMRGAGLMQAIARVNRTFRDKPGGLIVDYIGVFSNLQEALAEYSPSDRDQAGVPIDEIVAVMLEKHDIIRGLLTAATSIRRLEPVGRRSALPSTPRCSTSSWPTPTERSASTTRCWHLPRLTRCAAPDDEAARDPHDTRMFIDVRSAILKILNPDSGRGGSGAVEIDTAIWPARQRGHHRGPGDRHLQARWCRDARAVDPVGRIPR